jgi:hypothetical protein
MRSRPVDIVPYAVCRLSMTAPRISQDVSERQLEDVPGSDDTSRAFCMDQVAGADREVADRPEARVC